MVFDAERLRDHRARQVLEDRLAEMGIPVRLRRVGERLIAMVSAGEKAQVADALSRLAPDAEVLILDPRRHRLMRCPDCRVPPNFMGDWVAMFAPRLVDVAGFEVGEPVECPHCGLALIVTDGDDGDFLDRA